MAVRLLALLPLLVAACDTTSGPVVEDAEARELGPDDFLPDAAGDLDDAGDLADAATDLLADADVDTGLGDPCLILAPDCQQGLKCVPRFDGTGECRPVAAPPIAEGESCGRRGFDDCDTAHLCVSPDEILGLRCFPVCDADTGTGCPDGTTCSDRLPILIEAVGICL